MKTYELKLNEEQNAFVCKTQKATKECIELLRERGIKAKIELSSPVSQDFRGYYFAGVIGFIHKIKMYPQLAKAPLNYRNKGVSLSDVYHELLKQDFNGIEIMESDGTIRTVAKSIAVEDSGKFTEYLDRINEHISENFGMRLPTPEEYNHYRDTLQEDETGKTFVESFVDSFKN